MSPWLPDNYYALLNGAVQDFKTNSMRFIDDSKGEPVSCEVGVTEQESTPGIRKRGRPRLFDPHGGAAKEVGQ